MSSFNFNKIYVIESLDSSKERQTGKDLFDDLLRWKAFEYDGKLMTELIQVFNRTDFFSALNHILNEARNKKYKPIIHLELHGSSEGICTQNGEFINWHELYCYLSDINLATGNNLFLTLGICYGAYLMSQIKLAKPAPFFGFIGSFFELESEDILIRYNEFYKEFLSTFNFYNSIQKLFNANPNVKADYKLITSEETFRDVYANYLQENCSTEGIKKRVDQMINEGAVSNINSRQQKRKFTRDFTKELNKTKELFKQKHKNIFFMVNEYPENHKRFNLSDI